MPVLLVVARLSLGSSLTWLRLLRWQTPSRGEARLASKRPHNGFSHVNLDLKVFQAELVIE